MPNLNRVLLIGHLGRDAEVRYTLGGSAVARFSLATTDKWKGKDGQAHERTEWHHVDLWGRMAENLSQYLTKGKAVFVEGSLQTDEWVDKDGQKRKATKIRAERVQLMGGGERSERQRHVSDEEVADLHSGPIDDSDVPF